MNKYIGSNFDDFLKEEGVHEGATATAVKRVIAWQFSQAMKAQKVSKTEMAARLHTSRMVANRLLDERHQRDAGHPHACPSCQRLW